jgi:hypothetical protein
LAEINYRKQKPENTILFQKIAVFKIAPALNRAVDRLAKLDQIYLCSPTLKKKRKLAIRIADAELGNRVHLVFI